MKANLLQVIFLATILFFASCVSDNKPTTNPGDKQETSQTNGEEMHPEGLVSTQTVDVISLPDFQKWVKKETDTLYIFNFWATWCKPCIEEMPDFEKLAVTMKDKKVKLIFVSIDNFDNSLKKVQRFVDKNQIVSKVVLLDYDKPDELISRIDKSWNGTIPATMFVDNNNKTKLFYQQEFSYPELQAIVSPLLPFEI